MKAKSLRQSLSKAYLKAPVFRPEIEKFKAAFVTMQGKIDPAQNEATIQNHLRDFLLNAYYRGIHEINARDRKDLAIMQWRFKRTSSNNNVSTTEILNLPLALLELSIENVSNKVTKINALKKENQPTDHLEAEIDLMVYKLYDLTHEEVLIVDPEFGMTEGEYEAYRIL